MARPRLNPDSPVTSSQARAARLQALREAGGWSGRVELSAAAYTALQRLQGDHTISETIEAALIAAARTAEE